MMKFEMTGGDALARALNALPQAVSMRVQATALRRAAEPIRSASASHAPRSQGPSPHLADHIVIGDMQPLEGGGVGVPIGPEHQPNDFFYGYFQERGTVHHGPQAFMRPGFDEAVDDALQILSNELWQAITRPSSGGRLL